MTLLLFWEPAQVDVPGVRDEITEIWAVLLTGTLVQIDVCLKFRIFKNELRVLLSDAIERFTVEHSLAKDAAMGLASFSLFFDVAVELER